MTFTPTFRKVFLPTFNRKPSVAAAAGWWLSGGIAAANCIAAYQPKGAASLAASYTNLANPGTYNAAPGVAPTWDVTNGWISDGSKYLNTGFTGTSTMTIIIRFSNVGGASTTGIVGSSAFNAQNRILPQRAAGLIGWRYGVSTTPGYSQTITSGTLALAKNLGYLNGVHVATDTTTYSGTPNIISIMGTDGGALPVVNYVQACAFYSVQLDATTIGLLTTAMNAL